MENSNNSFWLGYKAMLHCRPIIRELHNARVPRIVNGEKHIDLSRPHKTILNCGSLEKCYQQIFDAAVEEYNARQTRKDRKITNYLEHVTNDKRRGKHKGNVDGSRKGAYELIIQLGNRNNRPDDEKASAVLEDFTNFLIKKYPNIIPIGIYLHADEFSIDSTTGERVYSPVHIHFDFIYVAHLGNGVKTGPKLQSSMTGALKEMGFVTAKGKGTAQQQWEEAVRHDLQDFAEERGFKIDRTLGEKHSHKEKPVYQQMKENELKEKQLKEQEEKIAEANKDVESKLQELSQLKDENAELLQSLDEKKKNIEHDKQALESSKRVVKTYTDIQQEVDAKQLTIDSEIESLKNDKSLDFNSRLNRFITNVKNIVTALSSEIGFYKSMFKSFWSKCSSDFRKIADIMDRNNCNTYSDYYQKYCKHQLDYQIDEAKHIKPIIHKNGLDSSADYER